MVRLGREERAPEEERLIVKGSGLILAVFLLAGCSASPSADLTGRLEAALEERPDDTDLLLLRRHGKPERARLLAALKTKPMFLAAAVEEILDRQTDEAGWDELAGLLETWVEADADNALPAVLIGLTVVARGDLEAGVARIIEATRKPAFRSYELSLRQESYAALKRLGLTDLVSMASLFARDDRKRVNSAFAAGSLLKSVSINHIHRRRLHEAGEVAKAEFALASLMVSDADLDSIEAFQRAHESGAEVAELYLMNGQAEAASRAAGIAREWWRMGELHRTAVDRDDKSNPVVEAFRTAVTARGKRWPSGGFDTLKLVGTPQVWDEAHAEFLAAESKIRPYLESWIAHGRTGAAVKQVSEEDRRTVESLPAPVDRFWTSREFFWAENVSKVASDRMVEHLAVSSDKETELGGFLRRRAVVALIRRMHPDSVPSLRALLEDRTQDSIHVSVAAILAIHGSRGGAVRKRLEYSTERDPHACYAASLLGGREILTGQVRDFYLEVAGSWLTWGPHIVPLYHALRDVTGRDFGFKSAPWREWGIEEGLLKQWP